MNTSNNPLTRIKKNGRKPYQKPAVVHREIMESVAGACDDQNPVNGKTGSGGDYCTMANS